MEFFSCFIHRKLNCQCEIGTIHSNKHNNEYQPSGAGGTRSLPATPHCLKNPKWPLGGPEMADGDWKGVYP